MEFKYDNIMVRYGELSTKGKNRKDFMFKLTRNIKERLQDYPNLTYKTLHDGIFIKLNGENYEAIKEDLKQVFGYSFFEGTIKTSKDINEICEAAFIIATNNPNYKTFKVVAKRQDKSYPMHSDEINRAIATKILKNSDLKVDVHNPDLKIYCAIREDGAYLACEKVYGYGGYPSGINGKALVMMSGGIDSPVAAHLTMKRGIKIECIHFASQPYTSVQALDKVYELARIISPYQGKITVHVVPFTDIQLAIYKNTPEPYCVTLMRRMMYRIADQMCKDRKIAFISNGESIGQVASQTVESIKVIEKVCDTLILRPVAMMDKLEIIDYARKIGTFDTSILPYEDCCTIFDPKNPVTKPKEDKCLYYESLCDYDKLIKEAILNTEYKVVSYRDKEEIDIL